MGPKINKLRVFYILALVVLATLSTMTHVVLASFNRAMESDGAVINVAGRQRMLSQRIASNALQVHVAQREGDTARVDTSVAELERLLRLWTDSHRGLVIRDEDAGLGGRNTPEIEARFTELDPHFRSAEALVLRLIGARRDPDSALIETASAGVSEMIVRHTNNYLPLMNEIVGLYEDDLNKRLVEVSRAEAIANYATLAILLIVALFMFEPALRKLQEQRRDLETMKEAVDSHTLYTITDLDGNIVDVNDGFCRLSGYTREELVGQPHSLLNAGVHPKDFWQDLWATVSSGEPWRRQICNRAKDGRLFWVDATNVPQFDKDGRIERYISWLFDITEQKTAEEEVALATANLEETKLALDVKRVELQSILDSMPGLVFYKDSANNILDCNRAAAKYIGKPREEIRGQPMIAFFSAEETAFHYQDDQDIIASGKPKIGEVRSYPAPDGSLAHMRMDKMPIRGEGGMSDRVVVIATDISDVYLAEEQAKKAEERLDLMMRNSNTGWWDWYVTQEKIEFNDVWYTMLGYEPFELPALFDTWSSLVHPDDIGAAMRDIEDHLEGKTPRYRNSHRMKNKAGEWQWIKSIGRVIERDQDGKPTRMTGVHIDIQELRNAMALTEASNEKLKESQQRFELALAGSRDAIFDWDITGNTLHLSPRWRELLSNPELELETSDGTIFEYITSKDLFRVKRQLTRFLLSDEAQLEIEFEMQTLTGQRLWGLLRAAAIRDESGKATQMSGSVADVTSMKQAEEELRRLIQQDHLTGLASRSRLIDSIVQAIARSKRNKTLCAVLFFDFDRFKVVNDSLGHDVGDLLLCSIADRLSANIRDVDTAARFGGDEFVILLEDLPDADAARGVAQKLVDVCAQPHEVGGHSLVSTASIGLVTSDGKISDPAELVRYADAAMYEAKRRGRCCFVEFDSEMFRDQLERLALEEDLAGALEKHQLSLHYQPIFDLERGHVVGAEALMRWQHPKKGPIPPDLFIPLAEESQQILKIGGWALDEACWQLAEWRRRGIVDEDFAMGVNVSKAQLLAPDFTRQCVASIDKYGLPRNCLKIEVTETTVVDNRSDIGEVLNDLREQSIIVMMDDFGTGHSSLSGLHTLPIDELKIDRSFIQHADNNSDLIAILSSIVTLADHLSMKTIGEGIESPDHIALLQTMGCTYGQGYFWSRPLPPKDLEKMLLDKQPHRKSA